jgi:hypothetical protein
MHGWTYEEKVEISNSDYESTSQVSALPRALLLGYQI